MSIDRIGKSPSLPPPSAGGATPTSSPRAFSVEGSAPTRASAVAGASPAEQVRQGEISLDQYLDLRVREATAHLEGRLGPADLTRIQKTLREQLASDPGLRELVQQAAGQAPPVDE